MRIGRPGENVKRGRWVPARWGTYLPAGKGTKAGGKNEKMYPQKGIELLLRRGLLFE